MDLNCAGMDLTTLGLNLNSTESLSSTFLSPWDSGESVMNAEKGGDTVMNPEKLLLDEKILEDERTQQFKRGLQCFNTRLLNVAKALDEDMRKPSISMWH